MPIYHVSFHVEEDLKQQALAATLETKQLYKDRLQIDANGLAD